MTNKGRSARSAVKGAPLGGALLRGMVGAACWVSVSSPANARIVTFYSMGFGKSSCQEYLDASKGLEPDHFRTMYKEARKFVSLNNDFDQWLFGAVTATNFASRESGRHPDVRPTTVELITWVQAWCGTHPDDVMSTAVLTFLQEKWKAAGTPVPSPAPAAASQAATPLAATSQGAPQFVFVIFQKDVVAADMAAFLKTYRVAIDDGPNPDGYYKLRLAVPLPSDQLDAMLASMRSQAKIVSTAVTN